MLRCRQVKRATAIVRTLRPHHWLKNGFVYAPALFSGHALDGPALLSVTLAALAFSATASAGYVLNDVLDRGADRLDPVKQHRPIASGALPVAAAAPLALVLLAAGLALAAAAGRGVMIVVAAYVALSALYSVGLKTVAIVEAMVLAAGFLLRLAAGALAVPVAMSHWLLICGSLLALLLAFGKRVPDVTAPARRRPLYPASFLAAVVPMLAAVTLVAYTLYTVAPDTAGRLGSNALLLTVPLVLYGILRYLLLLQREGAREPTATLLLDRPLLITVVVWAVLAAAIVQTALRS